MMSHINELYINNPDTRSHLQDFLNHLPSLRRLRLDERNIGQYPPLDRSQWLQSIEQIHTATETFNNEICSKSW